MAIQLSDRDTMIFRFIEEHQVLLEKHIAWFISCDEKPVLIRDRLRKLFYLDYLLCERHGGKLPWWTTPTKPLVYMLSPLTRQLVHADESAYDLADCETQRHLLEVANLRMLFLMEQKEGLISNTNWMTTKKTAINDATTDACVTFNRGGTTLKVGIVNHPTLDTDAVAAIASDAVANGSCDAVWIISRDDAHKTALQKALVNSECASRVAFTTHADIYKSGVVKTKWQSASEQFISVTPDAVTWGSAATAFAAAI